MAINSRLIRSGQILPPKKFALNLRVRENNFQLSDAWGAPNCRPGGPGPCARHPHALRGLVAWWARPPPSSTPRGPPPPPRLSCGPTLSSVLGGGWVWGEAAGGGGWKRPPGPGAPACLRESPGPCPQDPPSVSCWGTARDTAAQRSLLQAPCICVWNCGSERTGGRWCADLGTLGSEGLFVHGQSCHL